MDSEIDLIDKYFQELTNSIEVIINRMKLDRKLKLKQFGEIYERSKVVWSEILDIKNLRLILLGENQEERLV